MSVRKEEAVVAESDKKLQESEPLLGIRMRGLVVGIVMMLVIGIVIKYADLMEGLYWDINRNALLLPSTAGIGAIALIVFVINPLLRLLRLKFRFDARDVTVVYVMSFIGSVMMGRGMFIQFMLSVTSLGTLSMIKQQVFAPLLERFSSLVIVKDSAAIRGFQMGGRTGVPWAVWIGPIIWWSLFFAVLWFVGLCLAVFVRRRWTTEERLSYPLVTPLMHMYDEHVDLCVPPIWRSKVLWLGVLFVCIYDGINMLHSYFPAVPMLNVNAPWAGVLELFAESDGKVARAIMANRWGFTAPPLWAMGAMWFVTTDLLFSLWFFNFVYKTFLLTIFIDNPVATVRGFGIGEYLAIWMFAAGGVFYLYVLRKDLKEIAQSLFRGSVIAGRDDADEPLPHKVALVGAIFGYAVLVVGCSVFLRLNPIWPAVFFFFLFMVYISVARMRIEQGLGWGGSVGQPMQIEFQRLLGPQVMNTNVMIGLEIVQGVAHNHSSPTASLLEVFEMARRSRMSMRSMTKLVGITFVLAVMFAAAILLPAIYEVGAQQTQLPTYWWGHIRMDIEVTPTAQGQAYLSKIFPSIATDILVIGVHVIMIWVLGFMRMSYVWWPFNPVGLVAAMPNFSWMFPSAALVLWVVRIIVFRYGGPKLYRTITPFFVGIMTSQAILALVSAAFGMVAG